MESIYIISNYYPPEKGAAANRIEQLALNLKENNYMVTVICPLANYPEGKIFEPYRGKFSVSENLNGIRVKRLWIVPSNSKNILARLFSTFSFSVCLFFFLVFGKLPQKVIVQSPPLLLSFISVAVLWMRRRKIILNVSDLWPLAALELGVLKPGSVSHSVSLFFEKFIYKRATMVLGQSLEILSHVKTIVPEKPSFLYRNYPNHSGATFELKTETNMPIKVFYAGLLGVAQGVFELCQNAKWELQKIELHIFGDGAEKEQILAHIATHPDCGIYYHGMMDRKELHQTLTSFDVALVPLKTRIYGSVPSKIFEYGCLGFPILYSGGGEGEALVADNHLGWVVNPGDYKSLNEQLKLIRNTDKTSFEALKKSVYENAKETFNLQTQMEGLIAQGVF